MSGLRLVLFRPIKELSQELLAVKQQILQIFIPKRL